jgi:S1-C subfamily serine protease
MVVADIRCRHQEAEPALTIVDVIVVLFAVSAAVHGLFLGASTQLLSWLGLGAGLTLGAAVAPRVVSQSAGPLNQGLVALLVVFGVAILGGAAGRAVGERIWGRVRRTRAANIDAGLGAVIGALGSLVASWLTASMLVSVPLPTVADAIQGSVVLGAVDKVLPPAPQLFARVQSLLQENGFPPVFADFEPGPASPVSAPLPADVQRAAALGRASTVKIIGMACAAIQEGSGVVVGPGEVVTNAHVVAGVDHPVVQLGARSRSATPVLFDDNLDLAVLRVSGLSARPLTLRATDAPRGTDGAALGYPGGGPFTVTPAAVRRAFDALGRDVYNKDLVRRPVYELQAAVRPGNSGGPMVAPDGTVIGIVFSKSVLRDDIGYALRSSAVAARIRTAGTRRVDTGPCT